MKTNLVLGGLPSVPLVVGDTLPLFGTADLFYLLQAPELAPELKQFWLKFFPLTHNSDREKIYWDEIDTGEYRLAPYVAPNVAGIPMADKGYETKNFKPAYVQSLHVVNPERAVTRRAGESFLGTQSLMERFDAIVADNIRREREAIENRWEYMACRAVTDGTIVIRGERYPEVTVDFGRDASLTNTLSGGALWTAGTATVLADLQRMRDIGFRLSRFPITNLIFGREAWAAFLLSTHGDVQELLNAFRRGNASLFDPANINDGSPFQDLGYLEGMPGQGTCRMWRYEHFYESMGDGMDDAEDAGTGVPYIDPKCVYGVGAALNGVKAFGAIMDIEAGLAPVSMFPSMWDERNPSQRLTAIKSAPLMVPLRPNNSFKMKVVA